MPGAARLPDVVWVRIYRFLGQSALLLVSKYLHQALWGTVLCVTGRHPLAFVTQVLYRSSDAARDVAVRRLPACWHLPVLSGIRCLRNLRTLRLGNDPCTRQFASAVLPSLVLFRHLVDLRVELPTDTAPAVLDAFRGLRALRSLHVGLRSWTITKPIACRLATIVQMRGLRRLAMVLTGAVVQSDCMSVLMQPPWGGDLSDVELDLCGARMSQRDVMALGHLGGCRSARRLALTLWGTELWDNVLSSLEPLRSLSGGLRVVRLDVGGNHLGQQSIARLGSLLRSLEGLRTLDLGLQGLLLGPCCDMEPLAHLKDLPVLSELRLCLAYCHIGDAGLTNLLGGAAATGFPALRSLGLDLRNNDVGDVGVLTLSTWMRRMAGQIRWVELCLAVNNVTDTGAESLQRAVATIPHATLYLHHNLVASPNPPRLGGM